MKIYTKTGDKGETSLFTGMRVSKAHNLIEATGTLDELNASIGVLVCSLRQDLKERTSLEGSKSQGEILANSFNEAADCLEGFQSQIFSLGSYLASECKGESHVLNVNKWVKFQEDHMDKIEVDLTPLKNFILPGGAMLSCRAHQCRVLARKAERLVVGLRSDLGETGFYTEDQLHPVTVYLNRLSDFFFMFSRWVNFSLDVEESVWKG